MIKIIVIACHNTWLNIRSVSDARAGVSLARTFIKFTMASRDTYRIDAMRGSRVADSLGDAFLPPFRSTDAAREKAKSPAAG